MSTVPMTRKYVPKLMEMLRTQLNLKDPQLYFPCLKMTKQYRKNRILNTFYILHQIEDKASRFAYDLRNYNNYKLKTTLVSNFHVQDRKYVPKDIFTKAVLTVNPILFIMDQYRKAHNRFLPSCRPTSVNWTLRKKISSYNNEAYVGALFSYLVGKDVETYQCLHFPKFFGTFAGIRDKFYYDISVEYSGIKHKSWFKKRINEEFKVFSLDGDYPTPLQKGKDDDADEHVLELTNVPVQVTCYERLDDTLDSFIKAVKTEEEMASILFQITFGVGFAQEKYGFTHNDLHSSNIMYTSTKKKYLFYQIDDTFFKVPTFGKIMKIIDFERGVFQWNNHLFFSEVFNQDGDATGQYTFLPHHNIKSVKTFTKEALGKVKKLILPNPSFDLCRLATTIYPDVPSHFPKIRALLKKWLTDSENEDIRQYTEFNLYKMIAKQVRSAVPRAQFKDEAFNSFAVENKDVPRNVNVFRLTNHGWFWDKK